MINIAGLFEAGNAPGRTRRAARSHRLGAARAHFGRRSERIGEDQIELALEDVEAGFGVEDPPLKPVARSIAGRMPWHVVPIAATWPEAFAA